MILWWHRREIYMGPSLRLFSEMREVLTANGIQYEYRLVNHNGAGVFASNRARFGTFGENIEYATLYYLYVHKRDYDKTCFLFQ